VLGYPERRRKLADPMREAGVGLLFLAPSSDLEYLTGVERMIPTFGQQQHGIGMVAGAFFRPVGHGIGMDIHERPFVSEEDHTPLEVGMTFTAPLPGTVLTGS